MKLNKNRTVIASDVSVRGGIGGEIYRNDELVLKPSRDDTEKTKAITVFKTETSLNLMEEAIETFRRAISWDLIDYNGDGNNQKLK
jgi:hypothetical protein